MFLASFQISKWRWILQTPWSGNKCYRACFMISCWDNTSLSVKIVFCFHDSMVGKNKTTAWLDFRLTHASKQTLVSVIKPSCSTSRKLFVKIYLSVRPTLNEFMKAGEKRDSRCQTTQTKLGTQRNDGGNCVCWMINMVSVSNLCLWYLLVASCWLESHPF